MVAATKIEQKTAKIAKAAETPKLCIAKAHPLFRPRRLVLHSSAAFIPNGMTAHSRGLSEAIPPDSRRAMFSIPVGIAARVNRYVTTLASLPGCMARFGGRVSGGIVAALLNHRLCAANPAGFRGQLSPITLPGCDGELRERVPGGIVAALLNHRLSAANPAGLVRQSSIHLHSCMRQ